MGKGRDKRQKSKGSTAAGHGAAKTERKTQHNQQKKQRREAEADDDIDAILAELDAGKKGVHVEPDCPPPGPRICCVWLPNGDQRNEEIVLFGGELWDQAANKVYVYDDLFKYHPGKNRWTHIKSPGPHPRSACSGAVHGGFMFIFGGEFTSPNQQKFKHFRDLWRLDLSTWQWEEVKTQTGPSARSGSRMLYVKGFLYLLGGFYDTGAGQPKYYNDLWRFDLSAQQWEGVGAAREKGPAARSAFQWVAHGERLLLHGGYSMTADDDEEDMTHGNALNDTWALHLDTHKWERIARQGMAPSRRSSFAMVAHKDCAILFGGAADEEAKKGEVIVSSFFNDLYQLNLKQGRWYPVTMRIKKGGKQQDEMAELTERLGTVLSDEDVAKQEAATRIQAHFRGHVVRKAYKLYRVGGTVSEVLYSPAAYGVDLSSQNAPKPRARINASACVLKGTLWLFGGCVEIGDQEISLDDIWKLDLNKLDGWAMVKDNAAGGEDFTNNDGWESDSGGDSDANDAEKR